MINWILMSSVLIVSILLIRKVFGVKLTPGVQYGLWLLVLIRLLIPVNFFHSSYSLAAEADRMMIWMLEKTAGEGGEAALETNMTDLAEIGSEEDIEDITYTPPAAEEVAEHTYVAAGREYDVESLFYGNRKLLRVFEFAKRSSLFYMVWFIGMAVTGGIFLLSNLFFRVRIYSDREEVEEELEKRGLFSKVPVYVSKFVATPCLAGLRTPAVYIPARIWKRNTESKSDSEKYNGGKSNREKSNRELEAMLCHENVHYRHGDQLWSFLRLGCLIVHWYNPLVWAAAFASRQDAELFCDAGTVRELGEESRYEYGRILLRMTMQKEGHFGRLSDSLGHTGLCNTEMTDTKKHMERRIRKLAAMPDKSAIAVTTLTLLFGLAIFGYLFTGKEEQSSFSLKIFRGNDTEQKEVVITQSTSRDEKESEETFYPLEEEVEEVRKTALVGMSEEEIDGLTTYVKDYHNWLEARLLYDNWESRLSDQDNVAWNFIDRTGEVQAGWCLEEIPSYYLEAGEAERRKYLQEKYPEYGTVSLEELSEKYGEPYYEESRYGAETVIQRMKELTASAENKAFQSDVEKLCNALQQAKDTHEVGYVMQAHEILHDMEYFLLRYSPRDVAPYTQDKSLSGKYYGVLEVWKARREGHL